VGAERGPFGELEPGVVFDGRFVVERVVGVGGMGCVIAAQHLNLDRRVAIKIMLATPGEDAQGRRAQRLVHEARAAAKLKSDHGLRIFDVVSSGAYAPYIVMEYLEGESLSQRLRRGQLSPAEAVDFTVQACEAVEPVPRGSSARQTEGSRLRHRAQRRLVRRAAHG
jgi:serine/threonine-protein kinase